MEFSSVRRRVARAFADIATHGSLPGYSQLPYCTRLQLDARAWWAFVSSAECMHVLACLLIWELFALILVWHFDLRAMAAAAPPALASLWLWPWLADTRRRHLHRLLGGRWPA